MRLLATARRGVLCMARGRGNPLACCRLRQPDAAGKRRMASAGGVYRVSLRVELAPRAKFFRPRWRDVRVLGAIGVVETTHPVNMAALQRFFVGQGVRSGRVRQANLPDAALHYLSDQLRRLTRAVNDAVHNETFLAINQR